MSNGIAYGSCIWCSPWKDTAQLNYWNTDTRNLMLSKLKTIASMADGIRCDMSHCILNNNINSKWGTVLNARGYTMPSSEFWAWAIPQVKSSYPGTIFLAETYDQLDNLVTDGFDYVYEKTLLDKLKACNLDDIRSWITTSQSHSYWLHSAHFTENHDEDRAAAAFSYECTQANCGGYPDCCSGICPSSGYPSCYDGNHCGASSTTCCTCDTCPGRARANAAATVTMTLPGMRFYWQDQWNGYENKLEVHMRRSKSETPWAFSTAHYSKLNGIVKDTAFTSGTWNYAVVNGTSDCWRLMAWRWNYNNSAKRLVVINYSDTQGSGYVVVPDVTGSSTVTITELFSGTQYSRSAPDMRSTGLNVIIPCWSAQIFQYP
eukprot:TRINITY_DN1868_c0_g1_i2.p1 TRINITY_DN1868_c0_g1~~TRINITY_DN1868_c0_g1_i2.p1  ORF type:complete len:375 (+),score=96.90 TRINITY_DN1868_c0_g1_i2:141-1265(+)